MMTVTGLRKLLEAFEANGQGDSVVLMSKDGEGNSYSPAYAVESAEGAPIEGCAWFWELSDQPEVGDDRHVVEGATKVVVLWPTC